MKNNQVLIEKLENALDYLYKQENDLKPYLEVLNKILLAKINNSDLTVEQAFEMYCKIQEQYTNSILLITKIKEIIEFKD